MTSPADREFQVLQRGAVRDIVLNIFRSGLRQLVNPETSVLFTEEEIAQATAPGSRWYREASGIDDYGQGAQRNALFLNDQAHVDRACTSWLEHYHARLWDSDGRLPATGGSGTVTISGTDDTPITNSTTVPDPTACWGRDSQGFRYQAYSGDTTIVDGAATITMVAMDTGIATNLPAGSRITWAYRNEGMAPEAVVAANFVGGTDVETDAEWISRIEGNIRYRQGGGNDAQQRAWARRASNSIDDAFVYPCFLGPNSFAVCITQKRGITQSPTASIASATLLTSATAFLVPPGSPVEPSDPFVLVMAHQTQDATLALDLDMPTGSTSGWTDAQPWPLWGGTSAWPSVATISTSYAIIGCPDEATLPGQVAGATVTGADIPNMMIWSDDDGCFYAMGSVASVEDNEDGTFTITWTGTRPSYVKAGCYVSPHTAMFALISEALVAYFDHLGPGEIYASTHEFFDRCQRFPEPAFERPCKMSGDVAEWVREALGGACSTVALSFPFSGSISPNVPTYPSDGPYKLAAGGIYVRPLP
jgi:hypothetical protein